MSLRPLYRRHHDTRVARAPGPEARITIRPATMEDDTAVARLAALYDRPRPEGQLLLAEVDGELQAALTLGGDRELMDPFRPTAALLDLLKLRADYLRAHVGHAEAAKSRLVPEAGSIVTHESPALLDCRT
jgi:hypothetical protein